MTCLVHCIIFPLFNSGGGEGSLDRLLSSVNTSLSPRKRTTSQCKSEPPLLRTSKRTIYTAGRPPWYNEHGTQSKEAFVIGQYIKALRGGKINANSYAITIIVNHHHVSILVSLYPQGFVEAVLQAKQQLLVKLSRPWMFLGWFFCQWILSTR